jgi:hypothetical protein
MSKPPPAQYRTTNWSSYTASLRKRGSLLIWLDKNMIWLAPPDRSPGRPVVFSDAAIPFCLTIKVLFKLPLRQTTEMVASLSKMADLDWAVPDYTTLCRRQKTLAVQIPYRRVNGPLNLLVDIEPVSATGSSEPARGIKFLGDGEWQARKHGVQGRRQWHYGRAFRKRWTGYHARSWIEAKMRCLKSFRERIAARHPDNQTAEIQIRAALINRFNLLGTAEIIRMAGPQWGKRPSCPGRELRSNARQSQNDLPKTHKMLGLNIPEWPPRSTLSVGMRRLWASRGNIRPKSGAQISDDAPVHTRPALDQVKGNGK